jgi:hypothetical protein
MLGTEALYYPEWDPPERWLKKYLLFAEKVRVIVPVEVAPEFTPANRVLMEEAPELFEICRYEQGQVSFDAEMTVLECAFAEIGKRLPTRPGQKFVVRISKGGQSSVEGCVFVHRSKLTASIEELLKVEKLSVPTKVWDPSYLCVQKDAAHLLIGLIADDIGGRNGWQTVTADPLSFALNTFRNGAREPADAFDMLASVVAGAEVPDRIEQLTVPEYLELRNRYSPLRKMFHGAMREAAVDGRLDRIKDVDTLIRKLGECQQEFGIGIARERLAGPLTRISGWTPFFIGTIAKFVGLNPSLLAKVAAAGVDTGVRLLDKIKPPKTSIFREPTQKLIASLQSDVLTADVVKSLRISKQGGERV